MSLPKQERALRTRQTILLAAAEVFDEHGYQAASIREILARAEVTKGALYFHFPSKEALAQGVIEAQMSEISVPEQDLMLQALVDTTLQVAQHLKDDVLLRAGVRLTVEQGSFQPIDPAPYQGWIKLSYGLLQQAGLRGELLPHVDIARTAELVPGCFTGIQLLSQALTNRADVVERVEFFWSLILPGLAVPGVLVRLRFARR